MKANSNRVVAGTLAALVLSGSLLLTSATAAPQKKGGKKPPAKKDAGDSKLIADGKKVYDNNGCNACHAIAGKGGTSGPALDKVGDEHDAKWLAVHVQDPKAHKEDSTMPGYKETIKGKDLLAIGAYMASLKTKKK